MSDRPLSFVSEVALASLREAERLEDALAMARDLIGDSMITPIGARVLERAIGHLIRRHESTLPGRPVVFDSEQAVFAHLKTVAAHLRTAGENLEAAAQRLLSKGDGIGARLAHEAGLRAATAADSLDADEDQLP